MEGWEYGHRPYRLIPVVHPKLVETDDEPCLTEATANTGGGNEVLTRQTETRKGRRSSATIVVAIVVGALLIPGTAQARRLAPRHGVLFGAHVSPRWGLYQGPSVRKYEDMIGRKFDIVNRYHAFSYRDMTTEKSMASEGRIPMISWKALDGFSPNSNRAREIAAGNADEGIRKFARAVKRVRRPVFIRMWWEFTQAPGRIQFIGEPREFKRAWRHVVGIFRHMGVHNAKFVWDPQAAAFCNGRAQSFYPGNRWVDWIGGSAVPVDNFRSFRQLFECFYKFGKHHPKPLMAWSSVIEKPGDPYWKAGWMRGVKRTIQHRWPRLKAFVYMHSDYTHTNYWADTTQQSMDRYIDIGCSNYFNPNDRRTTRC